MTCALPWHACLGPGWHGADPLAIAALVALALVAAAMEAL